MLSSDVCWSFVHMSCEVINRSFKEHWGKPSALLAGDNIAWWTSPDGTQRNYFEGVSGDSCHCAVADDCQDGLKCNCDAEDGDEKWVEHLTLFGLITMILPSHINGNDLFNILSRLTTKKTSKLRIRNREIPWQGASDAESVSLSWHQVYKRARPGPILLE